MESEAELRALIKQNLALTEELHHMVSKMRRAAMWGRFFQFVWWAAIIAVSGAAYYYYLEPYVKQIEQFYTQYGMASSSEPGLAKLFEQYFSKH